MGGFGVGLALSLGGVAAGALVCGDLGDDWGTFLG